MRFTVAAGILTGFAAVGAATPADQAAQPSHAEGHVEAASVQLPAVKGDWHIDCDSKSHCSYYTGDGASTGADGPLSARAPLNCHECNGGISCAVCEVLWSVPSRTVLIY